MGTEHLRIWAVEGRGQREEAASGGPQSSLGIQ